MYNVSQAFKNAIKQPSRMISAKIEIEDRTYFDEHIIDLSYEDTSNPSTNFEIGSTASATIILSLMDVNEVFETLFIKPFIGLDVNGVVEYVPLGVFYADQVERKKNVVSLTLFDGMIKLEQAYFSNLTYPTTIMNVMNEICNKVGIQFSGTLPNYEIMIKPEGYTYREMVGYIAQLCGGFAKFNRDGKLTIKSYAAVSDTYSSDHYIDYNKKKDRPYRIDKLSVQVGENILSKGTLSAGGSEVRFENPFMTDTILTDVYNKLNGFTYLPTWVKLQGNPALECGDIVTLTTIDSEIIQIPIMKHKLSYQGGLIGEIESEGESENQNTFSSSGSMSRKVERVVYEQALINEALINKANIDDLAAVNARIDNIYTNDLTAVNASIDNLSARTGTIETLLAGNLTADNFMAGAIFAGSGIIAEGSIGDAEISNLNAAKINAGILNAALVTIQGPNGHLKLSGNRLQVFANRADNSLYERVSLGDVNGDGSVYGFRVRGADGQTVLVDENGVTNEGITDGAVTNEKIAGNANIDGSKINIVSVVTKINEGTTTILGSKVYLDGNTLDIQFSSLKNTVTSQGETITQQSAQISVLNNEISSKVSTTTYQQDMTTINNSLDSITTRLGQAETEIQQTSLQIALKANATDVYTKNQIDGQLGSVNTQISSLSSQLSVQADEIALRVTSTEFNSLEFGGTNLLRNTNKEFSKYDMTGTWGDHYPYPDIFGEKGQTYTARVYLKSDSSNQKRVSIRVRTYVDGNGSLWTDFNGNWIEPGEEGYSQVTFTMPSDRDKIRVFVVRFDTNTSTRSIVDFKEAKLEKGNRATDWSPAPEDVDGAISGINSRLSTAESTITQHANEINLRVKTSDFTGNTIASLINQTATTITIQASRINFNGHVFGQNATFSGKLVQNGSWGTINIQDGSTHITGTKYTGSGLYDNYSVNTRYSAVGVDGYVYNGVYDRRFILSPQRLIMDSMGGLEHGGLEIRNSYWSPPKVQFNGLRNAIFEFNISSGDESTGVFTKLLELTKTGATFSTRLDTKDIYVDGANSIFTNAVDHNGSGVHLYVRPLSGGELRATVKGSTSTYVPMRAQHFYAVGSFYGGANATFNSDSGYVVVRAGSGIVYLQSSTEIRATLPSQGSSYIPIRASDYLPPNSTRESKKVIEVYDNNVLEVFRQSRVYTYLYKWEDDGNKKRLGLMLDEAPEIIHASTKDTINMYSTIGFLWKGLKDHIKETDSLSDEVNWLKIENQYLKQKVSYLENRVNELEAKVA